MTGTTNTELLACPWCGSQPVYSPTNPEDQGDAWSRLSCVAEACPAKPSVEVYDDDRDFHVREVGRLWNTRATPDGLSATLLVALEGLVGLLNKPDAPDTSDLFTAVAKGQAAIAAAKQVGISRQRNEPSPAPVVDGEAVLRKMLADEHAMRLVAEAKLALLSVNTLSGNGK